MMCPNRRYAEGKVLTPFGRIYFLERRISRVPKKVSLDYVGDVRVVVLAGEPPEVINSKGVVV